MMSRHFLVYYPYSILIQLLILFLLLFRLESESQNSQRTIYHLVQSHLENLHRWGFHHILGEVVPFIDCFHSEKFCSDIKVKPLLVHLESIAPCLLSAAHCEDTYSAPFVATL